MKTTTTLQPEQRNGLYLLIEFLETMQERKNYLEIDEFSRLEDISNIFNNLSESEEDEPLELEQSDIDFIFSLRNKYFTSKFKLKKGKSEIEKITNSLNRAANKAGLGPLHRTA